MINQLILGDCLEVMPQIPEKSIDLILADLPFQITSCKWDIMIPFEPLWECYKRVIKPNGAIVLFGSQPFTSLLIASNLKWFKYCWVWEKDQPSAFAVYRYQPLRYHEDIAVFLKSKATYNPQMKNVGKITNQPGSLTGSKVCFSKSYEQINWRKSTDRYPSTVLRFNKPKHNSLQEPQIHPTQKPVSLLSYLIRTYTNAGDLVLDNTMGSGSTIAACLETQRNYIGIEKDPEIYAKAVQRIKNLQPQLSLFDVPAS